MVEVTGVVGESPALWYFRYIASIFLTTQEPVTELVWKLKGFKQKGTVNQVKHINNLRNK